MFARLMQLVDSYENDEFMFYFEKIKELEQLSHNFYYFI